MPPLKLPSDPQGALAALHLPKSVLDNYDQYAEPVLKSPWEHFKAKHKKPWVVGFSESYSANSWRLELDASMKKQVQLAEKAGLVKKYLFENSNNNNQTQIQQIQSMIEQGANIIYTIAGSSTALNGVIKAAYQKGIPVVTIASAVTSPYAINLDANYGLHSILMALGIINAIGKKGNVITVQGLSGAPGSITYEQAEKPIFAACKNISVIANIYGQWSNSIAKTQMLTALATHPQSINGIYQQGNMGQGIIEALEQTGRSTKVAMSDDAPTAAFMAYWAAHIKQGFKGIAVVAPPRTDAFAAFQIGLRVLSGYGLRVDTIVGQEPVITSSNYKNYLQPGWTFQTDANADPPPGTFLQASYLNHFFNKKKNVDYGQGKGWS